ncbi:hypothetical protein GGX14DRAFT_678614 [Mycena pura]|uniref:Uncharacterized protein n=1 Tax=Mycena pura TaxID=153505 RepID=A0AAD6UTW3_9AGAR|nr:hypothetical protein GGX14DRAFT_678614 [Mycena pura]
MAPGRHLADDDEVCPTYSVAMSRSNTVTSTSTSYTTTSGSSSDVHWYSPFDAPRSPAPLRSFTSQAQLRRLPTPKPLHEPASHSASPSRRPRPERYIYTYTLTAGGAPLQFLISVEPANGRPAPGKYTFRLSLKVYDVERPIGEAVNLRLTVDPRTLDFAVFLFPGKTNVAPAGCLFSLRVWLRVNGVDHRIFGEDELWVGKDPNFAAVEDAVCARLRSVAPAAQVYDALVGRARVQFVVRWAHLGARLYRYSVEYDAGGVAAPLVDDLRLLVDGDPRRLTFHLYTVPIRSVPAGASHRLRVWLRSPLPRDDDAAAAQAQAQLPGAERSYVYQRLWKSDAFKIGGRLDFEALGPKLMMGRPAGAAQTVPAESWEYRGAPGPPSREAYQEDTEKQLLELA